MIKVVLYFAWKAEGGGDGLSLNRRGRGLEMTNFSGRPLWEVIGK